MVQAISVCQEGPVHDLNIWAPYCFLIIVLFKAYHYFLIDYTIIQMECCNFGFSKIFENNLHLQK